MPLRADAPESPIARRRRERDAMSDEELVRLCTDGDELAWACLVRRYRRLVYAVPNRAGLDTDRVEHVFHETFARLAERIDSLEQSHRVRAWIVTTARRLTIDTIRAKSARREVEDGDAALARVEDARELPADAIQRMEERHLVRQALLRVPERCRRLLVALFYDRSDPPRSYESIAADLDMPLGSMGPTRARCLAKLLGEYRALEDS